MSPNSPSTLTAEHDLTWAVRGPMTFMSRATVLFINMNKMIGKDFEAGLQNPRTLAER